MKNLMIITVAAVVAAAFARADFPAADYSLSCDGNVTAASSFLGGSALPFSYSQPGSGDYLSVRDSVTDKAFVTTDSVQPWSENLDVFGQGQWSMLVVARGAEVASGVYWDVGWCAWQDTNPSGWCTGFCLIRTANGDTALVRRQMRSSPTTILSAHVDNDTTKFHSYLVTHDPNAAGTDASPYFILYVDGVKVAQSTTLHQVWRNGYQFGGVYGGASNAGLANGVQFAIDEIGIWQTQLTAAQAAEVCAHYPVWPNVTRHEATMSASDSFSNIAWTPAWADSSTAIASITATDDVTLTIDSALQAYGIEVASADDFGLVLGSNGSLADVASVNLTAVDGKVVLDASTFPLAAQFLYSAAATVRVESATAVVPPESPEGRLAFLNTPGQVLEIAAPVTAPTVSGQTCLAIGNATGTQTLVLDADAEIDAAQLVLGAYNSACVAITQNGGSVALTGTGTGNSGAALVISQKPLSSSSYTIQGGTCDVSAGEVYLGIGIDNGLAACLTIGGGAEAAVFSAKRIAASDSRANARTVEVCTNGTLVLGSGGIDLASPGGRVTLAGGTVRTTASTALYAQGGVAVTGDVTIDVASGTTLTLPALSGSGTITKTGSGTLYFSAASPGFSGAIHVAAGAIGVSAADATGSGLLTFDAGTQMKAFVSADLLAAGGALVIDQPNLSPTSANPALVVVAPGGNTELVAGTDFTRRDENGTIILAFPQRTDGLGAWFDFTFTRKGLAERQNESRNIRNDGYAGANAYLLFDGDWRGTNGYDTANGRLLMKTTPCRDMTGAFAWPSNWTVAVASHLPATANACLLAVGSTSRDHGSRNYLALARGASSGEIRLVNGTGYTTAQTLATMSIPQTDASSLHLFILDYDGTTCDVYHASGAGDTVERIGTCTLDSYVPGGGFQVGSIHGGIAGTGLLRVNELPQADADACEVRSIRIFSTVLNASCRQALYEELVRTRGMKIVIR